MAAWGVNKKTLAHEASVGKLGQSNSAATKLSTHPDVALNSKDRMLDNLAPLRISTELRAEGSNSTY
jgi:hypothetical protein